MDFAPQPILIFVVLNYTGTDEAIAQLKESGTRIQRTAKEIISAVESAVQQPVAIAA